MAKETERKNKVRKMYKELNCIRVKCKRIKFTALVDSGSNVSIITYDVVKKLGLVDEIIEESLTAKSWNNGVGKFRGRITLTITLGSASFVHEFLVADQLSTQTHALLGLDFLYPSETHIKYAKDGVTLCIKGGKIKIPIVKTSTQIIKANVVNSINNNVEEKEVLKTIYICEDDMKSIVKSDEVRRVEPYMSVVLKTILTGKDLPKQISIENSNYDGWLIEPQLVTVGERFAKKGSKHAKICRNNNKLCLDTCPTKNYKFAYVMVFNATNKPILIKRNEKLATFENQYENEEVREIFTKKK